MSVLGKALQTSRQVSHSSVFSNNVSRKTDRNTMDKSKMNEILNSRNLLLSKLFVVAVITSGIAGCSVSNTSSSDTASTTLGDTSASTADIATNVATAEATGSIDATTTATADELAASDTIADTTADMKGTAIAESTDTIRPAIDSAAIDKATTTTGRYAEVAPVGDSTTNPSILKNVALEQKPNKPSYVMLSLSEPATYNLLQTTPTEFVLTLNGVSPEAAATVAPQILPKGVPGIRSVRMATSGNDTKVRMFVDAGVNLIATEPGQNKIMVQAQPMATAAANAYGTSIPATATTEDSSIRAQLQAPEADKKAAAAKPPVEVKENENTARENPTGLVSSDGSKVYTGRLISLDLQDTDIDNALRIIAEVSNLNIIASDDVTGKVTLRLIDVPWDQALDVILKTNGLDQVTEGNVIRIAPIEKLRQEREALKEAKKAQEALEDLTVKYIRVSYARATELKEQVESVLSERGTVSVDERTNQLIIKDVKKGQTQAAELLKKLDLRTPQVLLETQIVESGRNILRDLGFQWSFSEAHSPATGNATGLNFPNTVNINGSSGAGNQISSFPAVISDGVSGFAFDTVLGSADGSRSIGARLSALETEKQVRVISRPEVATVNNKQAEISSTETIRVRLPSAGTAISTGSGASASSGAATAFQEIKIGIELTVTPQASPDYFVLLDIKAKSSTLGQRTVDNIPSTIDRIANSTVLIKSGQTFALGGVYRLNDSDEVAGIPFIKDIPVLGQFFRRTFFDKSDEELIFFITPHIVEGSFDAAAM